MANVSTVLFVALALLACSGAAQSEHNAEDEQWEEGMFGALRHVNVALKVLSG